MAYFTSLWKARIIEKYRQDYENEKINSLLTSKTEIPRKTLMQRWRFYGQTTKRRMTGRLKQWFPDGSSVSNLYFYLKSDHALPSFVLKSLFGFLGGVILTYLCFVFFVYQLSISLLHATVMSSVIGVLLTGGLAFSCRMRCLVFLLIPQMFSRVGRYTLTCYALVLILTGPATNTLRNSEVLTESMACSQEQIKTNSQHITETMKKPFSAMKESIKLMVDAMKRATFEMERIMSKISAMVSCFGDAIQSSFSWLSSVADVCTQKFGTPYDRCLKAVNKGMENCRKAIGKDLAWLCNDSAAKSICLTVEASDGICIVPDYATASFSATLKRRLKNYKRRINSTFFVDVKVHHIYTYSSNDSNTTSQVTAGIVTEIRKRADPLLTWLSWSSCITSLFLLLIIFRAKYYQHMFETRSRFDNRYVTRELCELDFKRYKEKRETILPLNRRERTKYICISSFDLVLSEKVYITRSMVFMAITTFKLLIHMVADYSLYWVLVTMRHHGSLQTPLTRPSDAGVHVSGFGIVRDFIISLLYSISSPLLSEKPSAVNCLPNPYPPDLQRYMQIGILIVLLWFFALFEPYGLRFRHVIMGHYQPDRAKTRATWLYNHILKTRGSFMKLARRKLHREYKYKNHENLTFRHWLDSIIPCWCLKYIFGTLPKEPHCLLCNTFEEINDSDTKLTNCDTLKCPGVYCVRCFTDIGRLCTICLSPKDYGDMSDVSLEKGSSDESDDSDENTDIRQMKLKGTEKERLIKKSKSRKKNWKMLCGKSSKENHENTSLVLFKEKYENLDDINKIIEGAETNIYPEKDFDINCEDMKDANLTDIENNKNEPENIINEDTDDKSLTHLSENNISGIHKKKEQIVKKLISTRRHRRFLNKNRKIRIHVIYKFLGNLILRCLKFSQTCFPASSFYKIKTKSKFVKTRKVTHLIRSVHIKRSHKIERVTLKRKRRKRINKKTKFLNNKLESNVDKHTQNKCKENKEIIDSNDSKNLGINCEKYTKKLNKDVSKFKKHEYTFKNSYLSIKKFLTYQVNYFKTLKTACGFKKFHKFGKNRMEVHKKVNLEHPLRTKRTVVDDDNDKNTKDNSYLRNNKYLLHSNFNVKFHEDPLKETLEHKVTSDRVKFPPKEDAKNKMDNGKTVLLKKETTSFTTDNSFQSSRRIEMDMSKTACNDPKTKKAIATLDINESCKIIQDTSTLNSDIKSDETIKKSKVDFKKSKQFKAILAINKGEDTVSSTCNETNISDKTNFLDVSSLSDWWSPILERRT